MKFRQFIFIACVLFAVAMVVDRFIIHPAGRYQLDNHDQLLRIDTMTGRVERFNGRTYEWGPIGDK